ncbi:MAG: GNAT family N-acetyltransferase [Caulobacteraceae bacterium]|nr:GNAT family N-acetyltransferase [Caulobacteraceae bacterium]
MSLGLIGERVSLRPLTVADVSDDYVAWMNDPITNRFMETRWRAHSRADVEGFVADKAASSSEHLFGIFLTGDGRHVGNLKIGPIDANHGRGDLSYFIGETDLRGQGVASEAVALGVRIAFEQLKLRKLTAGIYARNGESGRVLAKNGFAAEGRRPSHFAFEGGRDDMVEYGLLNPSA